MDSFQIGVIATGTLLSSGVLTLLVGLHAWRFHYRTLILLAAGLMAVTGFGFAAITQFWPLLLIAWAGDGQASRFYHRNKHGRVLLRFPKSLAAWNKRKYQWATQTVLSKRDLSVGLYSARAGRHCSKAEHSPEKNAWLPYASR